MRTIKYIVVHCSATVEGKDFNARDIDRWHKQRGWKGIGYHYVVKLDGTIEVGRPENVIGAHVKGYNSKSIGVCYIGGLSKSLAPKDTRTPKQKTALYNLLCELKDKYPKAEILGHREFSKDLNGNGIIEPFEFSKACPSFNASLEYKNLCD
ncbi:N-acetylmuramoyl-L-alanine amidase [Seonamhaeicola sp. NFXS20]|uniref:N-acetylmuramoyl-L-alanine amidase n=1 Tax=Seonamhaeicola sp. NFXS20 TaxID=2816959 RepID=UPI003B8BF9E5